MLSLHTPSLSAKPESKPKPTLPLVSPRPLVPAVYLGFIAADGCVYRDTLSVGLDEQDAGHVEKLRNALRSEHPIRLRVDPRYDSRQAYLQISSQKLAAGLLAVGIHPAKSFDLKPWAGPHELLSHYWRGVIDGDGSVGRDGRGEWFVRLVGSRAMVQGFADFVGDRLAWRKEARPHKSIWHVGYVGMSVPQAVATLLYDGAAVYLDRKKSQADELMKVRPLRRKRPALTRDDLLAAYAAHRTWRAVMAALELPKTSLYRLLARFGL